MAQVLEAIEHEIRALQIEVAYLIDADGTVLLRRMGAADRVDLGDVPVALLSGKILTHYHPRGESLSLQDVRFLLRHELAEIRAVTEHNTFSLKRPPATEWEDVEELVSILVGQVRDDHRRLILDGALTFEESELLFWHDVWSGMAELRSWQYRSIPWEPTREPT